MSKPEKHARVTLGLSELANALRLPASLWISRIDCSLRDRVTIEVSGDGLPDGYERVDRCEADNIDLNVLRVLAGATAPEEPADKRDARAILDGQPVNIVGQIDFARYRFLGMWRPPEPPTLREIKAMPHKQFSTGVDCTCGATFYDRTNEYIRQIREHWQNGCFDLVQYVTIKEDSQ